MIPEGLLKHHTVTAPPDCLVVKASSKTPKAIRRHRTVAAPSCALKPNTFLPLWGSKTDKVMWWVLWYHLWQCSCPSIVGSGGKVKLSLAFCPRESCTKLLWQLWRRRGGCRLGSCSSPDLPMARSATHCDRGYLLAPWLSVAPSRLTIFIMAE